MNNIKIPIITVEVSIDLDILKSSSVNAMLIPSKNGKRLIYGVGYRAAKQKAKKYLESNYKSLENILGKSCPEFYYTKISYTFFANWLTKSSKYRKLRKRDVSNYQKNIEDVLFTFLGIDDSSIIFSSVEKALIELQECPVLHCRVELYTMDIDVFERLKTDLNEKNDQIKRLVEPPESHKPVLQ